MSGSARCLASRIDDQLMLAERISRYRSMVNFDYWAMRADAEQTQLVADARTKLYTAAEKLQEADLEVLRRTMRRHGTCGTKFSRSWPALRSTDSMADLKPELVRNRRVLNHQNKPDIPPDFKLAWLLDPEELAAIEANFKNQQAEDAARGKVETPTAGSDGALTKDANVANSPTAKPGEEKPEPQPAANDSDKKGSAPEELLPPLEIVPAAKQGKPIEPARPPLEDLDSSLPTRMDPIASRIVFSLVGAMVGMVQVDAVDQLPPVEVEPPKQPKKPSSAADKAKAASDKKAADAKAKAAAGTRKLRTPRRRLLRTRKLRTPRRKLLRTRKLRTPRRKPLRTRELGRQGESRCGQEGCRCRGQSCCGQEGCGRQGKGRCGQEGWQEEDESSKRCAKTEGRRKSKDRRYQAGRPQSRGGPGERRGGVGCRRCGQPFRFIPRAT